MIMPLVVLFLLGALQGAIGWIMVKSGLVPEKFYVGILNLPLISLLRWCYFASLCGMPCNCYLLFGKKWFPHSGACL